MKPAPEPGQLRVWGDEISIDKTPFLLVEPGFFLGEPVWHILWHGRAWAWGVHRVETFSEVISEAR